MNILKTVLWGLYLTCSWTWCIGMFLPILLIDRYGWNGFAMFAIPNVIGCTAFGYIVKTPQRSKAIVEKYRTAMSLFVIITIAFHAFFIAMISGIHFADSTIASVLIPICILIIGLILAFLPTRFWPILAILVWLFSIAVGFTFLPFDSSVTPTRPWQDAIWLLPITTFGFLLCPYLDPTFHKALQSSPSKHSFGVFGLTFALMIGVTCLYRDSILLSLSVALGLHLALQSIFTIGAHSREGLRIQSQHRKSMFVVLAIITSIVAIWIAHRSSTGQQDQMNDYLRFFVFYGFIFPGLVAVFMLTKRMFTVRRVILFAIIAVVLLPLLEAGYIGYSPWFTVLPVVVLLTWAFADKQKTIT